jgi:hypothetical protein
MASSDHPTTPEPESAFSPAVAAAPSPTGIQTSPETPIPLPPLPKPPAMSEEKFTRLRGYLDVALVALVLIFAFLIASVPVSNPDFFRQLATGRLLAEGNYHFGEDPFTFTSDGTYWVNHSWLFALLVYGIYQIPVIGGAAVVVCKALLVAGLAELMLRTSHRVGQSLWIPAVCTLLAILALSPRLFLQPPCLSFLFLGLTLWLLHRPRQLRDAGQTDERTVPLSWWFIPPLFALWSNCDAWVFVGPMLVALYFAGEVMEHYLPLAGEEKNARPRHLFALGGVLAAGLVACLINPHHLHSLTLPPELGFSPAGDLIEHDPQFRYVFLSPLQAEYFKSPLVSVASTSYFPLLVLGIVSFAFTFGRVPWWRLPVWVGFALLSLYNARAIPFFAIVAGPISALNWLDFAASLAARRPRASASGQRWALWGRALTIAGCVALLVVVVPGWLQSQPHEYHQVGWGVEVDPSLEKAALQIKAWRDGEQLPADAHWFNMGSDVASYLSWFAPGERVFHDQNLYSFRKGAIDYLDVRSSLETEVPEEEAEGMDGGALERAKKQRRAILNERGVHFWITDSQAVQKAAQYARLDLYFHPDEWTLCYQGGRIAIFAWKGAEKPPHPSPKPLDLVALAFGTEAEKAPPRGPEEVKRPEEWWSVYWHEKTPKSLDRESARLHLERFQLLQKRYTINHMRSFQWATAASVISQNALQRGPVPNSLLALHWSKTYGDVFPSGDQPARVVTPQERIALIPAQFHASTQDSGPVESLYLAIRAARRALLVNPDDAQSHANLGKAYRFLSGATRERLIQRVFPQLAEIRRAQTIAAFQNCLRCKPNRKTEAEVRDALAQEFYQMGYLDLAVHQLRERRRCLEQLGPQPGEKAATFAQNLDTLTKNLETLDNKQLKPKQDQYEVNAANKPLMEKVRLALQFGLAQKALEELEAAAEAGDNEVFRTTRRGGASLYTVFLELLLNTGQLTKAANLLDPDVRIEGTKAVNPANLHYHLRLSAARGDYEEADLNLSDALNYVWKDQAGNRRGAEIGLQVSVQIGRALLAEALPFGGSIRVPWVPNNPADIVQRRDLGQSPSEFWARRWRLEALSNGLFANYQESEWHLLRGWLALESGRCVEAREQFGLVRETLVPASLWVPEMNRLSAFFSPQQELASLEQLRIRQSVANETALLYMRLLDSKAR